MITTMSMMPRMRIMPTTRKARSARTARSGRASRKTDGADVTIRTSRACSSMQRDGAAYTRPAPDRKRIPAAFAAGIHPQLLVPAMAATEARLRRLTERSYPRGVLGASDLNYPRVRFREVCPGRPRATPGVPAVAETAAEAPTTDTPPSRTTPRATETQRRSRPVRRTPATPAPSAGRRTSFGYRS